MDAAVAIACLDGQAKARGNEGAAIWGFSHAMRAGDGGVLMVRNGNIFANLPERLPEEEATLLASHPGAVVERIVSTGQGSPPGFWYDQDWAEWVVVLAGAAGLSIEGEKTARILRPGDYVELPAKVRHRVEWTDPDRPTVWLAVHWKGRLTAVAAPVATHDDRLGAVPMDRNPRPSSPAFGAP